MQLQSRIAPTPSGYLHIGNALNFVRTWLWVRKNNGSLRLRIDDCDTTRAKPEYIEDIFKTLDWMGIDWNEGPQTPAEHQLIYSQALRAVHYDVLIKKLVASGQVYACQCSRKDLLLRPCNCREKQISPETPETSLRISTPMQPVSIHDFKEGRLLVSLESEMKDFVIKRRDGIASYQIASLTDDTEQNINLVIRGRDLLSSTAAQLYISSLAGITGFKEATFYHHPLQLDLEGKKLSKSAGSFSIKTMREQGFNQSSFYKLISTHLGFTRPLTKLNEMLNHPDVMSVITH